jgi:hypothetical protein
VEPPAGIEPATPSLPWNHQEPLCEPPFSQVAPDRRGRSYRFSFDAVMRSLSSRVLVVRPTSQALVETPVHHRLDAAAGQLEHRCHAEATPITRLKSWPTNWPGRRTALP